MYNTEIIFVLFTTYIFFCNNNVLMLSIIIQTSSLSCLRLKKKSDKKKNLQIEYKIWLVSFSKLFFLPFFLFGQLFSV